MKKNYKNSIVFTADIHWADEKRKFIEKPFDNFLEYVKNHKPKYTIIAGDYFHQRINPDSELFQYSIGKLIELSFHTEHLIVLKGTQSHDNFTLRILNEFNLIKKNIHYIETLSWHNIGGKEFLFIPEEYPFKPEEYYKDIYSKKVDFIVGHGELEGAKLHSGIDNRKLKGWKFNANKLEKDTNCQWSMWGHIHLQQNFGKKTMYSGSLARWKFGEEEEKGFFELGIDNNTKKFIKTDNYDFITFREDNEEDISNFEYFLDIVKNENVFLRFIGELDSKILKDLKEYAYNPVFAPFIPKPNIEDNNKILYEGIPELSFVEQYNKMIEFDIENKTVTKKQIKYIDSDEMKNKIVEVYEKTKNIS